MSEGAQKKPAFGIEDLDQFRARAAMLRAELDPPTAAGEYLAYTDGACFGNPSGPGGWAAAVFLVGGDSAWHLWGHLSSTSNNRAEALGVLGALEWVPPNSRLTIRSDSQLTVRILEGQYKVKANPDIWEVIRNARALKQPTLTVEWLRGHAGDWGNELADRLSKLGARNGRMEELGAVGERVEVSPAGSLELRGLSSAEPPTLRGLSSPAGSPELRGLEPAGPPERRSSSPAGSPELCGLEPAEPPELRGLEPRGEWERDFVRSLAKQLRGGRALSAKQQAVVDRIRAAKKPT